MNVMLMQVMGRTREIGVRRAVGARRRDIYRQFVEEAVVQTILGTVVSVSEERGRISIRDNSGNIVNISVSYFTPVERFVVSSQGGEFFSLAITELAERGVQVTGYFDSGVFNALSLNTF